MYAIDMGRWWMILPLYNIDIGMGRWWRTAYRCMT